jgi:hypothetical protein
MTFKNDKDAFHNDLKEYISYNQKIAKAKNELRSRLPPRLLKKKELWTYNKSRWEIIKINSRQAFRQFDNKSRGMGLFFILFLGIMIIVSIIPHVIAYTTEQINKSKYLEALKLSCVDMEFYRWNYPACEDIDTRPLKPSFSPIEPIEPEIKGDNV